MQTRNSFELLDSLSLHQAGLDAAKAEKSATLHLLEVLHWIEKRRTFSDRGYSSLFDYVHRGLGYSESQTSERIRTMRLAFEVAEIHKSLAAGRLTLTSAARMASHVRNEELKREQIVELLPRIENKSVHQVERVLATLAPERPRMPEKLRPLDAEHTELKLTLDEEALCLLEEARMLDADPGVAMLEIFKRSLRKYVAEKRSRKTGALKSPKLRSSAVAITAVSSLAVTAAKIMPAKIEARSRYVPRPLKRAVWQRAESTCEFVDARTGTRCASARALTLEHRQPIALGGEHTLENLALFCSNHNAHAAEVVFGKWKK